MSIMSNVQLQGNAKDTITKSTFALREGDNMFYSTITDITIVSGSTSGIVVLNRCAIIDEKPSDDLVYSLSKEALKEDPEMPQLTDCKITRCKLPKALYKECVYIDKEGSRIISGQGYLKREATQKMFTCQKCLRTLPDKEKGNLYRKIMRFTPSEEEGYLNTKEEEEHLDVCKECMKACGGFLDV